MTKTCDERTASQEQADEIATIERRVVTIAARHWDRFEAWAREPAREVEGLKELAKRSPTWLRA